MVEVILLKDVERLGPAGATIRVNPGFARNYLLPSGLAVAATPAQRNAFEAVRRQRLAKAQRLRDDAEALKRKLEGRSVTLKLTVGEEDAKPFGSVTARDVMDALAREGVHVEKHAIQLEQPLKALGVYDVPVRLHADVTAVLKVWVVKA